MKKLIFSSFFLAFMYGQEVTNGGFETNVLIEILDKEFIQNTMMTSK